MVELARIIAASHDCRPAWKPQTIERPIAPSAQKPMTTRRRAREIVLQLLYQDDLNPTRNTATDQPFLQQRLLSNKPLVAFARQLLDGIRSNRDRIDKQLGEFAVNWSVKRMSTIDRNILRLAAYEFMTGDAPQRVVINEAIELAKRYGQQNSSSFVNGILDRAIRSKAAESNTESESSKTSEPTNESVAT
jgi:transcription antitermination protein NusB